MASWLGVPLFLASINSLTSRTRKGNDDETVAPSEVAKPIIAEGRLFCTIVSERRKRVCGTCLYYGDIAKWCGRYHLHVSGLRLGCERGYTPR